MLKDKNEKLTFYSYTKEDNYRLISIVQSLVEPGGGFVDDEEDTFLYINESGWTMISLIFGIKRLGEDMITYIGPGGSDELEKHRNKYPDDKVALFDLGKGKTVTDFEFDEADECKFGVIGVYKEGLGWGLVNKKGKVLLECDKKNVSNKDSEFIIIRRDFENKALRDEAEEKSKV